MAEDHLEYGYLEGESVGAHFAEDPVGMLALKVNGGQKKDKPRKVLGYYYFFPALTSRYEWNASSVTLDTQVPAARCRRYCCSATGSSVAHSTY